MSTTATADLRLTFGAMFIGSVMSVYLCGISVLQTYQYFRHYRKKDPIIISSMVLAVWTLDFLHTVLICQGMWEYLVLDWGNLAGLDRLDWTIGASIAVTGLVTFMVQLYFAFRVWRFSRQNIFLCLVIVPAIFVRLGSALATTVKMIQLGRFSTFINEFRWLFTFGLALSCAIEILLTSALCYYLGVNRSGHSTMDEIIHKLLMYSISNGILTTLGTLLAMLFAVIMPDSFLFIAIHFVISKCYINSLLATLNSRDALKKRNDSSSIVAYQISVAGHSQPRFRRFNPDRGSNDRVIALSSANQFVKDQRPSGGELKVQVSVEREVHDSDVDIESDSGRERSLKTPDLSPSEDVHTTVNLPRLSS